MDPSNIHLFWDRDETGKVGWLVRFWIHGKPIDVRVHGREGVLGWHSQEISPADARDMVLAGAEHLRLELPIEPIQLDSLIDDVYRRRQGPS